MKKKNEIEQELELCNTYKKRLNFEYYRGYKSALMWVLDVKEKLQVSRKIKTKK